MALCSPLCGDEDVRVYCTPCDRQQSLRKGAINYIGLLVCSTTFTDISDADEWTTKLTAGEIKLLPELVGELGEPETTTNRLSACRAEEITDEVTTLTAQIFLFDNSSFTDFDKIINNLGMYFIGISFIIKNFFIKIFHKFLSMSCHSTSGLCFYGSNHKDFYFFTSAILF